jgi:hypothetical protein
MINFGSRLSLFLCSTMKSGLFSKPEYFPKSLTQSSPVLVYISLRTEPASEKVDIMDSCTGVSIHVMVLYEYSNILDHVLLRSFQHVPRLIACKEVHSPESIALILSNKFYLTIVILIMGCQ